MAALTDSLGGDFEKHKIPIAFQAAICTKLTAANGALPTRKMHRLETPNQTIFRENFEID